MFFGTEQEKKTWLICREMQQRLQNQFFYSIFPRKKRIELYILQPGDFVFHHKPQMPFTNFAVNHQHAGTNISKHTLNHVPVCLQLENKSEKMSIDFANLTNHESQKLHINDSAFAWTMDDSYITLEKIYELKEPITTWRNDTRIVVRDDEDNKRFLEDSRKVEFAGDGYLKINEKDIDTKKLLIGDKLRIPPFKDYRINESYRKNVGMVGSKNTIIYVKPQQEFEAMQKEEALYTYIQ